MILSKLIKRYKVDYLNEFMRKQNLTQQTVPDNLSILKFLEKFAKGKQIESQEFEAVIKELNSLEEGVRNVLVYLIRYLVEQTITRYDKGYTKAQNIIDKALLQQQPIKTNPAPKIANYYGLLNCLKISITPLFQEHGSPPSYSNFAHHRAALCYRMNAFVLIGELPRMDYAGLAIGVPFYPDARNIPSVNEKRGIKKSSKYFPYKNVKKILHGQPGDNTCLATNGKKIIYLRRGASLASNFESVLASKIATVINPTLFSSERLFDNGICGSKQLASYAVSTVDERIIDKRRDFVETGGYLKGSGVIDEVTNYLHETDDSLENIGFSNKEFENLATSFLSKIDFDFCRLSERVEAHSYEQDLLIKSPYRSFYTGSKKMLRLPAYLTEKLSARLKLSCLTPEFIAALAEKAYLDTPPNSYQEAMTELARRSEIALSLFLKEGYLITFLNDNPEIFKTVIAELNQYISSHFDDEQQRKILPSLQQRVEAIAQQIKQKTKIDTLDESTIKATWAPLPKLDSKMRRRDSKIPASQTALEQPPEKEVDYATFFRLYPEIGQLYKDIKALGTAGEALIDSQGVFTKDGECISQLSKDLEKKANSYFLKHLPRDPAFTPFKKEFLELLHRHDDVMQTHRKFYKVLIANIVISLTGVGAIAVAVSVISKACSSKPFSWNNALFFGQTNRQQKAEVMERHINKLSF